MNFIKKFLLVSVLALLLTGCSNGVIPDTNELNDENNKISLNITQADLIASVTDNIKYLNKDLLYEINTLDDSDTVNVIISLKSAGIVDKYNENQKGFRTVSEYANSTSTTKEIKSMVKSQETMIEKLIDGGYINKVNHSYTTLFNGFSATTTYGQFKALEKAGFDINVTLSEVYSKPDYQLMSTSDNNSTDGSMVENYVNVYETGIFNSSGVGYDGENTAVAILDSSFDIHHTVFKNMPKTPMITISDVESILYDTKAYGYKQNIKSQDVYLNAKIPFMYDYADKDPDVSTYDSDHGTHVAGIIGGSDDVVTGVAINTQLVLMKVFGDINNGAIQDDILAALEDAILLGVDAINLSLGTACGFSRSSDNEYINVVYDKIEAAGISLVVAASNDYSSGYGGENGNTNKASNPDSATVGSPGTYKSTLSVASISGVKSRYIVDNTGYTFFFNDANDNAGKAYNFYEMLYEAKGASGNILELEYVTVPGVGKKINYSSVDVKGKVALVKRGETSFEEKAQVALSQGAIGIIIYNNVVGDVFMNAGSNLQIPLASISKDDGEYLASKGTGKLIFNTNYLAGPFMSEFSSWGPVSDLSLKPEITAHGGSILSSVPGGGYDEISGTSMACPNLCGVVILVRQALKEKYPNISSVEITNLTNQLLMSTSTIILDENGIAYSPRKQGAGLCNLESALETLAYISVENSSKAKIELKDDPEETGIYELKFQINNTSNKTLKYSLSNLTMTESLSVSDPEYVAEKGYILNPSEQIHIDGEGSISNNEITIKPNGTVDVTYTITLSEQDRTYIKKSFINGIYIEGFVKLDSLNEDNIDLNVPFLAFFGDWTKAPMFDKTYYEVESEAHNDAIDEEDKIKADYYATTPLGTYYYSYIIPLGSYVYEMDESKYDPIPASEELASIGYSLETINGITTVYAGLLRNAKKMTTVIKNAETGEVVYEHLKYDEHKAYFSGSIIPCYDIINVSAAELQLQNNTKYTMTMEAELDYGDGGVSSNLNNSFEFSFYIDYESPIIKDAQFYTKYNKTEKEYEYYVDVYVYDNHYAQSIRPFTIVNGQLVSLVDKVIPIYNQGTRGEINKVTVEITDYIDLLQYGTVENGEASLSNGLGFLVDDYALNQTYAYVTLPGTNSKDISYKEGYYSSISSGVYQYSKKISIGDVLDLTTMLTSTDPTLDSNEVVQAEYFSKLQWTSSNENVIKVKNGLIEAVGAGSATIICTTMNTDGYPYSTSLKIEVRDRTVESDPLKLTDLKFTYFDTLKAFADGPEVSEIGEVGDRIFFTEKSYISCYPSEQVQIGFELEPWNLKNYELVWSSTNESVATVDENGIVTAHKKGNAIIKLNVIVNGKTSSLIASTRVVVKDEFIIEGSTLVGYKGLGGDVVIPDDKGILYIGPFAFSLYTTDYEIKIEDDDYDMAKLPESNTTVKSVVIPAEVKEVQKYAFYNCSELETITFLVDDENESCKIIREYAFYNDKKLKNINLENVQIIGSKAFYDCDGLEQIDLSNIISIGKQGFTNSDNLEYVDITALRNAGDEIFMNCTNLKTIDNGEFTNFSEGMFKNSGLTTLNYESDRIPANCFENCTSLKNVTIENNLVYVGQNAFIGCTNLESVKFNDNVSTEFIYEAAFKNCISLKTVVLPDSLFEIEKYVFDGCTSLEEITFNKNTQITSNLGSIFKGCLKLATFNVNNENKYYNAQNNLLLSKDNTTIIFAAPNYSYGNYTLLQNVYDGAFSSVETLHTLTIAENVSMINKYAFENCTNLSKVTILSNDIQIDEGAFKGCLALNEVENIENINVFNKYVFAQTALEILTLTNVEIKDYAFSEINTLKELTINNSTLNSFASFANCKNLEKVYITTKEIGECAFAYCENINILQLENVEVIKDNAFIGCTSLQSVTSNTVKEIGNYAFYDNKALNNISFENVEKIGNYAFASSKKANSNQIKEISFGNSLKEIGSYAFNLSSNLEKVTIGDSLNKLGSYAFSDCNNLKSIKIDSTLQVIEEGTFANDLTLISADIHGVKYIKDAAFVGCVLLESFDLSDVLEIGMEAFYYCSALTSLDMPNVKKLSSAAFLLATNVTSINMPKVEVIEHQALSCLAVEEIKLPNTISSISPTAFYYNHAQTKFVSLNNEETVKLNDYVLLDEGVLYITLDNGKYVLNSYPSAKEAQTYEVIFGTIRIGEYSGCGNNFITTLVFPDTLELIGNNAFYSCPKLSTVEFKSTTAPVLEGTVNMEGIEYDTESEAYKLLNKYFQFNGYYPLYYSQFKDLVGTTSKMNIIVSKNADIDSYSHVLYSLYFDLENLNKSDYEALNDRSKNYLNKVSQIPDQVLLSDELIIKEARTAYNLLNQDLTTYGYDQEYLNNLYNKLLKAEEEWLTLKMNRINHAYAHIIKAINDLGSTYDFNKISDYYEAKEQFERISDNDKKYIDSSNLDNFKKGFDEYFNNLTEDIKTITEITTLPTIKVNKVGLIVQASVSTLLIGLAVLFIVLRRKY